MEPGPASPADGVLVARERHPAAIRWMHWINVPLLFIMVWSGLRIYWASSFADDEGYALGILGWEWFAFFPDGFYEFFDLNSRLARGIAFHLTFGWLFVLNGVAYAGYVAISGAWRHLVPDRHAVRDAGRVVAHDLHLRSDAPPQGRYNAAQRIAYTAVVLLGVLIVATGFAIYKPATLAPLTALFGGYETARAIHFFTTMAFLAFVAVHVAQVVRAGWRNFVPMVTGYELQWVDRAEAADLLPGSLPPPARGPGDDGSDDAATAAGTGAEVVR